MAKKRIISKPGLFGTVYYYDESGKPLGYSRPGLLKGTRVYTDPAGRPAGRSHPGFLAGKVYADQEGNHITSYDTFGGQVHFKNGKPIGHTTQGIFDSSVTEWEEESPNIDCDALITEEMFCEECEEEEYTESTPEDHRNAVIRNVRLFALCIVICAAIACIYAILR